MAVDGGYSWIIVVATIFQMICNTPVLQMLGLLFGPKLDKIGCTEGQISAATSLYLSCWALITLFVGPLCQLRSARFVSLCSAFLSAGGLLLCAFSRSPFEFILPFGLIAGSGQGLGSMNSVLLINKYFKNKIGIAFGLYVCGTGLGTFIMPQIIKILLPNFEIETVILIYTAISCSAFIAPILIRSDSKPEEGEQLQDITNTKELKEEDKNNNFEEEKLLEHNQTLVKEKESSCKKFTSFICQLYFFRIFFMIKWSLVKSPRFLFVALASSSFFNSYLLFYSEMAGICFNKGLTVIETADIIAIGGAVSGALRLVLGFMSDLPCLSRTFAQPKTFLYITFIAAFVATLVGLAFAEGFVQILIFMILALSAVSGTAVNGAIMMREYFEEDLPSAIGISNVSRAILAFVQGPVVGLLKDKFSDYTPLLLFISCSNLVILILWCTERLLSKNPKQTKEKEEQKV